MSGPIDERVPLPGSDFLAEVASDATVAPAQQHLPQDDGLPRSSGAGGDAAAVQVVADLPERLAAQDPVHALADHRRFVVVDHQGLVGPEVPPEGTAADVGSVCGELLVLGLQPSPLLLDLVAGYGALHSGHHPALLCGQVDVPTD